MAAPHLFKVVVFKDPLALEYGVLPYDNARQIQVNVCNVMCGGYLSVLVEDSHFTGSSCFEH